HRRPQELRITLGVQNPISAKLTHKWHVSSKLPAVRGQRNRYHFVGALTKSHGHVLCDMIPASRTCIRNVQGESFGIRHDVSLYHPTQSCRCFWCITRTKKHVGYCRHFSSATFNHGSKLIEIALIRSPGVFKECACADDPVPEIRICFWGMQGLH